MSEVLTDTPTASRLVRRREVLARIGISEATLWRLEKRGEFPPAVRISVGGRAVGYFSDAVESWIRSRGTAAA
jgi:prophage regulatory protein